VFLNFQQLNKAEYDKIRNKIGHNLEKSLNNSRSLKNLEVRARSTPPECPRGARKDPEKLKTPFPSLLSPVSHAWFQFHALQCLIFYFSG